LDINAEMVRRGAAWFDPEYAHDDRLYWIEQGARKRKEGLWALSPADRVEPRVWRKER
jgi:endonuclease YncB( thermonuclease family)